jgi:hypothetical protein
MTTASISKLTRYHFSCSACGSFKFVDSDTRLVYEQCPCGKFVYAQRVEGTFSEKHVCDPACTSARGPVCVCACGGPNHGIAWIGLPTWRIVFQAAGSRKRSTESIVEATPAVAKAARQAKINAKAEAAAKKIADRNAKYAAYRVQAAAAPASDAQKRFITDLLSQKDVPSHFIVTLDTITKVEASATIEQLLAMPRKPVVVTLPGKADTVTAAKVTVPNGRYALTAPGETQAKFYRVNSPDKGSWKGYTFVSEIVGGGLGGWGAQRNIRGAAADAVLKAIAVDPQRAMADFGHLTNHCGKCKALLTDEQSVANGIGPVCIKTLGWTPRA